MSERRPVSRAELVWVIAWAALVMLVTCLPYLYALRIAGDRVFGGFLWGVDEGNVYLTWMRQAAEGHWLLGNQYCLGPENPHFLNLFLQLGGRLSALTGLPPIILFHALRLLCGVALLVVFYLLAAEFTEDRVARWAALGFASVGSGLGWLTLQQPRAWGLRPVDVGVDWQVQPEAITFSSLLLNPLFVFSLLLICVFWGGVLRASLHRQASALWVAGPALLLLGNAHTYDVFPIYLALAGWYGLLAWQGRLTRREALRQALILVACSLPSVLWALWAARADPAFLAKGLTPTPAFRVVDYVVGYGLILLLAVGGAISLLKRLEPRVYLPLCWAVAIFVSLLAPVSFQRKMIEGVHLPLCLLAGWATAALAYCITRGLREQGKVKHAMERVVLTVIALVVFTTPSSALFVSDCLARARDNNAALIGVLQPPVYLERPVAVAMKWLGTGASKDDIILSTGFMGSFIPTYCRGRVWIGHWAETLGLRGPEGFVPTTGDLALWAQTWQEGNQGAIRRTGFRDNVSFVHDVFGASGIENLLAELRARHITYVFYGPWEQAVTGGSGSMAALPDTVRQWEVETAKVLPVVYEREGVVIYRVPAAEGAN